MIFLFTYYFSNFHDHHLQIHLRTTCTQNEPDYLNVSNIYIFLYIAIPPRIFEMLQSHKDICRRYVRTCKEINIAFLAYEAQVQFSSELTDQATIITLLAVNR